MVCSVGFGLVTIVVALIFAIKPVRATRSTADGVGADLRRMDRVNRAL
ncbi:MAG: hypothetical protein ACJ8R9_07950 [Steroidobacteraceae bacterium]